MSGNKASRSEHDTKTTLLVDIGNSRVKWRTLRGGVVVGKGSGSTHALTRMRAQKLGESVDEAFIACVANREALDAFRANLDLPPDAIHVVRSAREVLGVRNGYERPTSLGVDRWLSLIAARAQSPGLAALVVTLGTAITIDALSEDGVFLGGTIAPGLGTMAASLNAKTAALPSVVKFASSPAPATNTEAAIANGVLNAAMGAIALELRKHEVRCGVPVCLFISGGDARKVSAPLRRACASLSGTAPRIILRENLVLDGLALVAAKQTRGSGRQKMNRRVARNMPKDCNSL